jgi:hypothetical protein
MLSLLLVEENLQCNKLGVVSFDEIHLHLLDVIDIIYVDNCRFINGGIQST